MGKYVYEMALYIVKAEETTKFRFLLAVERLEGFWRLPHWFPGFLDGLCHKYPTKSLRKANV